MPLEARGLSVAYGDAPAIWHTNRPAKGGDTGAMFTEIIEKAARLKADRLAASRGRRGGKGRTGGGWDPAASEKKKDRSGGKGRK